ncbi:MAG TPA: hypothetical protein VK488_10225 [Gaiellaceae bacterium]|nr:hypothetical protein [Gaiellaceae bacterium]
MNAVSPLLSPILLAVYPVLSLFEHNQSEVDVQVLWRALALAAASGAALFVLFALAFRRGTKAGALASLAVIAFFYYGIFTADVARSSLSDRSLFPLWMALFVLAALAVLRTKSDLTNLNRALSVFALAILVIPVYKAVMYRIDHPPLRISDPRLWPSAVQKPAVANGAGRPDIYFIIPDDYERPDVLKRYFNYDDSGFIRRLEKRGFALAGQSRSPYSKSEFNMASTLNMDYLSRLPKLLGRSSQDVLLVRKMIEDSRASRVLGSLGYRYIHIDSDNITFAADNPHISTRAAPDNLTYLWLRDSVLRLVGGRYGFTDAATDERFRKSVRSAFAHLEATPKEPGPKLVVFHTLLPHDPYVFGARGQDVTFPDQSDTGHSTRQGMRYYVRQLEFVNLKLLEATDAILASSKTPPIIVIQSDEGFEALPEDFGEAVVQDMRVKGLSAFYLPGAAKHRLPQSLNTVNSFRFLFNQYFGTHYPMLKSASYPELDLPYQFEKMPVR